MPRWFDSDGMLMLKIIGRPHWEDIQIQFERGKEIASLSRKDWEAARRREA